jgi:hypothetical protein
VNIELELRGKSHLMNKVNEELEEVGYKRRKVDLLVHYAYCEWKIRTREESGRFPSFVLWSSG